MPTLVEVSEESIDLPRKVYKGVLQGGSSSAISYIFYESKITQNLPQQVSVLQFADDTVLYINTSEPEIDVAILSEAIKTLSYNLEQVGLSLAPQKTEFIHFNKRNVPPVPPYSTNSRRKHKFSPKSQMQDF